jgi:hypothetical protein
MRNAFVTAVAVPGTLAVIALGSACEAGAASSGFGNALDTINALQGRMTATHPVRSCTGSFGRLYEWHR